MTEHSVAETKNQLSALIDRAIAGEKVVITRHGKPVAEIRAVPAPPRRITKDDIEWVRARRVGKTDPSEDAAQLVRRMRDEGN